MKLSGLTPRRILPLAAAVTLLAITLAAFSGAINTQRIATIYVTYKTAFAMPIVDTNQPVFVVDSNHNQWRVDNIWLWKTIHENASYRITFKPGFFPDMGVYPTIIEVTPLQQTPYTRLGTNPTHEPFNYPYPPPAPVKYIYGVSGNFTTIGYEWVTERNTPLLQPRWLPEGMRATAVYVRRANVTSNLGIITQVTRLYSFGGDADPNTAELQVRVQMVWDEMYLNPKSLYNSQLKGNYTEADGKSAWMGVIGMGGEDWYQMYGGTALIMSIQVGQVRYLLRMPEGFPEADLMKIARSMGFYE
jgi:hypothetical protein